MRSISSPRASTRRAAVVMLVPLVRAAPLRCERARRDSLQVSRALSQPRRAPPWRRRPRWRACVRRGRSRTRRCASVLAIALLEQRGARRASRDRRRAPLPGSSVASPVRSRSAPAKSVRAGRRASSRTLAGTSQTTRSLGCSPISARRLRTRSTAATIDSKSRAAAAEFGNLERIGPVRRHDASRRRAGAPARSPR